MIDNERFKLRFGPYKTPRFSYGATVQCEVWGEVQIVGQSDGRIPWPRGRRKGTRSRASLIVYKGLAKAVSKEANQAKGKIKNLINKRLVTNWLNQKYKPLVDALSCKLGGSDAAKQKAIDQGKKEIEKIRKLLN